MNILLIEPAYRNKYPPLGLMKIATYHKLRGDYVDFFKGCSKELRGKTWDRIYVSSLFTFYWSQTIKTIEFYRNSVKSPKDIYVGGVLASLMTEELTQETGATVIPGLLDKPGMLGFKDKLIVDHQIPDYSLLDEIEYKYPVSNAYFGYATRGCPNNCQFCAVPKLEPFFQNYSPLRDQVEGIADAYGQQRDLVLLDNNVLKSTKFKQIIHDIITLGFEKGAKFNGRLRHVDFNQGIDARRITSQNMKLLSKIALHPIRFAYDTQAIKPFYENAARLAGENGMRRIGTYVLFNYIDTPYQFFDRLEFSIKLNTRHDLQITSFPMKFVPFDSRNRSHVGKYWKKRYLRGIQCILLATHGMVSPHAEFFYEAFGENKEDFIRLVSMPEHYIIHRHKYKYSETAAWTSIYQKLSKNQRVELIATLEKGRVTQETITKASGVRMKSILEHYLDETSLAK